MKQLFGTLFLAISFIGTANAQLLYRVSGNGLDEPSYIVGTYHLAPASFVDEIKGAKEALAAVEQVYGEVDAKDMGKAQQLMVEAMMLPDGKHISDLFTEDELGRINAYMREVMGVDLNNPMVGGQLGRMRPSVLAMQLIMMQFMKLTPEFDATNLIDEYFQKEARKAGKPVGGFESVAQSSMSVNTPWITPREYGELCSLMWVTNPSKSMVRSCTALAYHLGCSLLFCG